MDVTTRAVATAAVASLLAVCAVIGEVALTVAAALVAVGLAIGWPALLRLPSRWGSAVVIGLGGVGAVLTVSVTDGVPALRHLPAVFAGVVVASFVHELLRRDRVRVVDSVAGVTTGALVAATSAAWLAGTLTAGGVSLVVVGSAALAIGAALSALPLPPGLVGLLTVSGAVAGAAALATVMPDVPPGPGAVVGLAVGVLLAALRLLFDGMPTLRERLPAGAAVLLPVAVSGAVVYVVGRVLVG